MADTQEVRIQVIFRTDTQYGAYQDALWFSQAEYDALKQEDLDTMKQARIDKWIDIVSKPAPELTKAEQLVQVQSEIDNWTARITELQSQKAIIEAKIG